VAGQKLMQPSEYLHINELQPKRVKLLHSAKHVVHCAGQGDKLR